jgi:hypothetical protein
MKEELKQRLRETMEQHRKQKETLQGKDIPTEEIEIEYLPLEDYLTALQQIPIVFSAKVLFDDRPEEVSIRIEYVENLRSLSPGILHIGNYRLTLFTNKYRIEGCKRINITYIQKEVIG